MNENIEKNAALFLGVLLSIISAGESQGMLRSTYSFIEKSHIKKVGVCAYTKYFADNKKTNEMNLLPKKTAYSQIRSFLDKYASDWTQNSDNKKLTPKIAALQQDIWRLFLNWEEANCDSVATNNFVVF